ncbi:hypothetical protein OH76DRAFT_1217495 [Lentinus brumalis]|uniref:Uncharacterized protein n=1 Tax=Lentinus brumalis TaxID=2498619 RepID=A0A371DLH1_9APHY|nr:hypothetical protein OH76DRAFT_1217495 [Polyporus brumalis]
MNDCCVPSRLRLYAYGVLSTALCDCSAETSPKSRLPTLVGRMAAHMSRPHRSCKYRSAAHTVQSKRIVINLPIGTDTYLPQIMTVQ